MKEMILKLANSNPGALHCLMGLLTVSRLQEHEVGLILLTLDGHDIKGTDIYVLWNDITLKQYGLMFYLVMYVPKEELVNACSKQDRTGRQLLINYIDKYQEIKWCL